VRPLGGQEAAPFARQSCAAVTLFHTLEHLYEPRKYLRAAHELLRPGGRLIIQVPNAACWQFLLLGASWNGVDVPRHLYDFRPADLDRMLDSCGFEVLRRKYFSLRDNPAGLATSLAPGLDPKRRTAGDQGTYRMVVHQILDLGRPRVQVLYFIEEQKCRLPLVGRLVESLTQNVALEPTRDSKNRLGDAP